MTMIKVKRTEDYEDDDYMGDEEDAENLLNNRYAAIYNQKKRHLDVDVERDDNTPKKPKGKFKFYFMLTIIILILIITIVMICSKKPKLKQKFVPNNSGSGDDNSSNRNNYNAKYDNHQSSRGNKRKNDSIITNNLPTDRYNPYDSNERTKVPIQNTTGDAARKKENTLKEENTITDRHYGNDYEKRLREYNEQIAKQKKEYEERKKAYDEELTKRAREEEKMRKAHEEEMSRKNQEYEEQKHRRLQLEVEIEEERKRRLQLEQEAAEKRRQQEYEEQQKRLQLKKDAEKRRKQENELKQQQQAQHEEEERQRQKLLEDRRQKELDNKKKLEEREQEFAAKPPGTVVTLDNREKQNYLPPLTIKYYDPKRPSTRLDVERAKRSYVKLPWWSPELDKYVPGQRDKPTTIYPKWDSDVTQLGTLVGYLARGLVYARFHPEETERVDHIIKISEDFIIRFHERLKSRPRPLRHVPWSNNWYQFSISTTYFLAMYLLSERDLLRKEAITIIHEIIEHPYRSLQYSRDLANSIQMAGPWILAHYYNNTADEAMMTSEYSRVLKDVDSDIVVDPKAEGLHMDRSYLFHNLVLSFGYLTSLVSDTAIYFYALDTNIKFSPFDRWIEVAKLIIHPYVPFGNVGLMSRAPSLTCTTNRGSVDHFGIKVLPFSKYIRWFERGFSFTMRAQTPLLSFYEADQSSDKMAQHWVQMRRIFTRETENVINFPEDGYITKYGDKSAIKLPIKRGETTRTYFPDKAKSFVMQYQEFGIMYQEYYIKRFGKYSVIECIIINRDLKTIDIQITILNADGNTDYVYHAADKQQYIVKQGVNMTIATFFQIEDIDTGKYTVSSKNLIETKLTYLPLSVKRNIYIYEIEDSYVLFDNNLPVIISPNNVKEELSMIHKTIYNVMETFMFDTEQNQYIRQNMVKSPFKSTSMINTENFDALYEANG